MLFRSQSIWEAPGCDGETAYVRHNLECRDQAEVRLFVPYSGPIYLGDAESCTFIEDLTDPNAYTYGEEVAPETFVAGELQELPGVCQASLRVVVSEDGARLPYEVVDIATGAACDTTDVGCRPKYRAFEEGLFTDASCETMAEQRYASWISGPNCAPPDFIRPMGDPGIWYRAGALSTEERRVGKECRSRWSPYH